MKENKLETITNLFEGSEIRSVWDGEKEDYYFSVVDVIRVLTDSNDPMAYWRKLKQRLKAEGSQTVTNCHGLKMKAKDGKRRFTDTLDTEGILRLTQSVPSPKAEPFKMWLATLGKERIDEVFDPSIGIDKMINFYLSKEYTLEWIEQRIKAIINRKKLTSTWKENGISDGVQFGILTNEIYKSWSGMKASEYKQHKSIRKESLRDNMTDIEVALTDLGEIATRELVREHKPKGLEANKEVARIGGHAAKVARDDLEKNLGRTIISKENSLGYKYTYKDKLISDKTD